MENSLLENKLLIKYLIVVGLVYAILKIVPSQTINNKDILLILGIVSFGFIILDYCSSNMPENFADTSAIFKSNNKQPSAINVRGTPNQDIQQAQTKPVQQQQQVQQQVQQQQAQTKPVQQQQHVQTKPVQQSINEVSKAGCGLEVEKIKRELEFKMEKQLDELKRQVELSKINDTKSSGAKIAARYLDTLIIDLSNDGIINKTDVDNIRLKMNSKVLSIDDIIISLEMLKNQGNKGNKKTIINVKDKNSDADYNELPNEFYKPLGDRISNKWDDDYTLLSTNNWQVPMTRPPVCINTTPCTTCPVASSGNSTSLKEWDNSRNITQDLIKINKKWAEDN
jgi:hypothetical protein